MLTLRKSAQTCIPQSADPPKTLRSFTTRKFRANAPRSRLLGLGFNTGFAMKLSRFLLAGALAVGLVTAAYASGMFPGFPASTSAGTAPANAGTGTGTTIVGNESIPADTALSGGRSPQTMLISPSQIANYVGGLQPRIKYTTFPIGSVAYGSLGTNTTPVSGTIYYSQLNLPQSMTITNIGCMNGGTAATDKLIYALYDSTGALLKSTALTGTVASGTDSFQSLALTATYAATRGEYFIGWQTNGTTTRFRTAATLTYIDVITGSQTGVFATLPAITSVASTFTADVGPFCFVS